MNTLHQNLIESILEDEGLTDGLTDDNAQVIINWCINEVEKLFEIQSTEDKIVQQTDRIKQKARLVCKIANDIQNGEDETKIRKHFERLITDDLNRYIALTESDPIYTAAILGYLSHLIIDMNNTDGIALTYPAPHRWIFPANIDYRFRVGSKGENILRGVLIVLALAVTLLHFASPRTILHRIMGTPTVASTEYYQQLLTKHKVEVEISGIWTHKQSTLQKEQFEVIAADDFSIYVRRYDEPKKIYAVGTGPYTSISHAKITPKMSILAEQRVVSVTFENEKWRPELVFEYPNAIISGQITTNSSSYPTFDVDEFQTIHRFSDTLTITHCPIERLSEALQDTRINGTLYIRYWRSAER